jgi:hypothetical protein
MKRSIALLFLVGFGLTPLGIYAQTSAQAPLKIFLNEVQPGVLAAPQYCILVFDDHRFHSERADIKQGRDKDRKVYEGQLSESDWNALLAVIDSPAFRDLNVPTTVPPLVLQDTHPYTISVARDKSFQNMEFIDDKSLKPYAAEVKPLLRWWKSVRGQRTTISSGSPDARCALDRTHGIFTQ